MHNTLPWLRARLLRGGAASLIAAAGLLAVALMFGGANSRC